MRAVRHIAEPPRVPAAPLIGGLAGALAYRRDPPASLRRWRARLGPVFTLSLAGVEMTVVAGAAEAEPVLRAPDTRLGARAAQARFGFERTLGPIALHVGTDLHQALLLRERRRWDGDLEARLCDAVARALDAEPPGEVELFAALRRVALRATARAFGSDALAAEPFLARFAAFQDALEEATARGAALPGFVARPLVYEPVHRRGRALVREVVGLLHGAPLAPYLAALRARLPDPRDEDALGEIVLGLLFAAHKNVAIGAAQLLCFTAGAPPEGEALDRAIRETLRLCALGLGSLRQVRGAPFPLGPWRLPPGRLVAVSHQLLARDPALWDEPDAFRPARFAAPTAPFAWIPFGAGPHGCPGRSVALRLIRELAAAITARGLTLQGAPPPLDFTRATLAQRRGPVRARLG